MIATSASRVPAADDIQQINLGPHNFYVPKIWMRGGGVVVLPHPVVDKPQPVPIDATTLAFRPQDDWRPYGARELPKLINLGYVPRKQPPPLDRQRQHWLDLATSLEPDRDGLVRVASGFTKPGEPPQWEAFLYKGYLNKFGEPLIVMSQNMGFPLGNRVDSTVDIALQPDIGMEYRFDNNTFSKKSWWDLYEHVLAFVDYVQRPK